MYGNSEKAKKFAWIPTRVRLITGRRALNAVVWLQWYYEDKEGYKQTPYTGPFSFEL